MLQRRFRPCKVSVRGATPTLATLEVVALEVARSRSSMLEVVKLVVVIGSNSRSSSSRSRSL